MTPVRRLLFTFALLVFSLECYGLAQTAPAHLAPGLNPADASAHYGICPAVSASDPAAVAAVNWLISKGAPTPSLFSVQNPPLPGFAGTPPNCWYLRFSKAGFADVVYDADLTIHQPSVTLTDLEGRFNFGNPFVYDPYVAPAPPAPSPAAAVQPSNPIGPVIVAGGSAYFAAPGDTSPIGSTFTDAAGSKYVKSGRLTPFGQQSWWVKQ